MLARMAGRPQRRTVDRAWRFAGRRLSWIRSRARRTPEHTSHPGRCHALDHLASILDPWPRRRGLHGDGRRRRLTGGATALAQGGSIFQGTLMEANQKTAEVSTDELRQILKDGSATVFDSRPHLEYAISHIPGALNVAAKPGVPMSVYVSDVAEIERLVSDKSAPLVLYCNGPFCGKSKRLGEELLAGRLHRRAPLPARRPDLARAGRRHADRAGRRPLRAGRRPHGRLGGRPTRRTRS